MCDGFSSYLYNCADLNLALNGTNDHILWWTQRSVCLSHTDRLTGIGTIMNGQHNLDQYKHMCWLTVIGINTSWRQAKDVLFKFGEARNIQESCALHTSKDAHVFRSSFSEQFDINTGFICPLNLVVRHCTQDGLNHTPPVSGLYISSDYTHFDVTRKDETNCKQGQFYLSILVVPDSDSARVWRNL
jgi:hypothetical protein